MSNFEFCLWNSSCGRKVRFSRSHHAQRQIERIARAGGGFAIENLVIYHCSCCGGYHFGHRRDTEA